jgi:TRAP-type C4-dicarboxylate transport system permease small subunit
VTIPPGSSERGFAALRRGAATAAAAALLAITLLGAADVAGRTWLDRPLLGQVEITRMLLIYAAFLGMAEAAASGGHIRLQALDAWLGPRARAVRDVVADGLALLTTSAIAGSALFSGWDALRTGETLIAPIRLPAWLVSAGLALGFLLFAAELVRSLIRRTSAWTRS